jgi:peptidyl-tRNA hydrolase, PTH1 family
MVHAIIGLGNPGREYHNTRHNLGRLVVEKFSQELGSKFKNDSQIEALHSFPEYEGRRIHLILPETYMNESGRAVGKFLHYYKEIPSNIVVVVDDMALPFETMRLRESGSAGGHNGLKSIERTLGTREYPRLRLGIGRALYDARDYVLSCFSKEEQEALDGQISRAVGVLKRLVVEETKKVMLDVNRQVKLATTHDPQEETKNEKEKSQSI